MADAAYPMITQHCPRCDTEQVTFDVREWVNIGGSLTRYEAFMTCRKCNRSTIFELSERYPGNHISSYRGQYIDGMWPVERVVVVLNATERCPEYVPEMVKSKFEEAEMCRSVGAFDASGAMFRKVIDLSTRSLLPVQPDGEEHDHPDFIAWKVRKDLRLRLDHLFNKKLLAERLSPLADCIREDGNDAAHDEIGIGKQESDDLLDFTLVLLEEIFTLPGQIAANVKRRSDRRLPQ